MQRYGVDDLFDRVVGNVIDKAEGLMGLCTALEVEGRDIVYWGDTIYDIEAAKKAGVCSGAVASEYAYHTMERLNAANPDFMLCGLSWLRGI